MQRIAILGAGGVGGYYGGILARAGNRVAMLARGAHLEALRERGLEVRTPEGSFIVEVEAAGDPGELDVASRLAGLAGVSDRHVELGPEPGSTDTRMEERLALLHHYHDGMVNPQAGGTLLVPLGSLVKICLCFDG